MKNIILIITSLITVCLNAQTEEEVIANIRKEYQIIESAIKNNEYSIETLEFNPSDKDYYNEELTIYKNGNDIRKIVINRDYSESSPKYTLYINNNSLFFAFYEIGVTQMTYGIVEGGPDHEIQYDKYHEIENRYYFNKGKPIRCLEKRLIKIYPNYSGDERSINDMPNKNCSCQGANESIVILNECLEKINNK